MSDSLTNWILSLITLWEIEKLNPISFNFTYNWFSLNEERILLSEIDLVRGEVALVKRVDLRELSNDLDLAWFISFYSSKSSSFT